MQHPALSSVRWESVSVAVPELPQSALSMQQQRPDFASLSGPGGSLVTLDGQYPGQGGTTFSLSRRSKEVFDSYRPSDAG